MTAEEAKAVQGAEGFLRRLKVGDEIVVSEIERPGYEAATELLHAQFGRAFSLRRHPSIFNAWTLLRLPDTGNIPQMARKASDPPYSEFEQGERHALLHVRSFIAMHGLKEVDDYCAQRLHDMLMDARHRECSQAAAMETPDEYYRNEQKRHRLARLTERP